MPLLCDPGREIAMAFGVAKRRRGSAARTTFVLDADGTVVKVYEKVSSKRGHAPAVLKDCKELWGPV